jgi:hypothetical protein
VNVQFKADPIAAPTSDDVKVIGDLKMEAVVIVLVGVLLFRFQRVGALEWVGSNAMSATKGAGVDETYIASARALALDAMRHEAARAAGEPTTTRCTECGRLLVIPADMPRTMAASKLTVCGPEHVYEWADGTSLRITDAVSELRPGRGLELQQRCDPVLQRVASEYRASTRNPNMDDLAVVIRRGLVEALEPIEWRRCPVAELVVMVAPHVQSGKDRLSIDYDGIALALAQDPPPAAEASP